MNLKDELPLQMQTKAYWNRYWKIKESYPESVLDLKWKQIKLKALCRFCEIDKNLNICDIGCGMMPKEVGYPKNIALYDVSSYILSSLNKKEIKSVLGYFPYLDIEDSSYSKVVCMDLLCQLKPQDYRISISELSRILSSDGQVCLSVTLDTKTISPLNTLQRLIETEFIVEDIQLYYMNISERIRRKLQSIMVGERGSSYSLKNRIYNYVNKLISRLVDNFVFLKFDIMFSRMFFKEKAPSHAIIIAKKKPLRKSYH